MYKYSGYDFSDAEIDQIVSMAEQCGGCNPIDRRKYTDKVVHYGLNYGLLRHGQPMPWCKWEKADRIYVDSHCSIVKELPPVALWRIVEPILRQHLTGANSVGYSITKCKPLWDALGMYHNGDRHWNAQWLQEQWDMFARLAGYGIVWFMSAGDVWEITIRPESEWTLTER